MSTPGKAWTIEVYREIELLGRYEVPLHRLETNGVAELLKALVSKYEEFEFQELVDSYLNKRKGGPGRCLIGSAKYFADTEKATSGYWVFGPPSRHVRDTHFHLKRAISFAKIEIQ